MTLRIRIRRNQRIAPAPALATLLALGILGSSSQASAEDTAPQWSEGSSQSSNSAALRAVDPNQAPKAEDFVGDEQYQSIDEQLAPPQQNHVPSVESRFPKIDIPKDIAKHPPQNPQWMPKSPLVQINKSGLKPQVLKKPTGGGSIKGMGITFNTSLQTGASSMSVPIAMPPGRRGLAPGLSLGYSSGGGQGICGQGWSIGVGFIARQTDQVLPSYDEYDRFVYNGGQELVRVGSFGTPPSNLFDGANFWTYRSKIEGLFWRFFRVNPPESGAPLPLEPEYWVAQDRNGTLYYFGDIAESKVQDANAERVFRWNLTLVKDVHNNQVEYEWSQLTGSTGQAYLTGVYYNNHPTQQKFQHRIELEYAPRDDVLTTYQAGYEVTTNHRLVNIWVWTDYGGASATQSNRHTEPTDSNGNGFRWLVRRYAFDYKADRYHSLLDTITLIGNDNNELNALPPARFHYQEVNDRNGATSTVQVPEFGELNTEVRFLNNSPDGSVGTGLTEIMDIDGDGLVDVLRIDPTSYGDDYHRYILGYGDVDAAGFITPALDPQQTINMGTAGDLESRGDHQRLTNSNVQIMDVDGDGAVELIHMPRMGTYQIYELRCEKTLSVLAPYNPTKCEWELYAEVSGHPSIDLTTDAEEIKLIDVNGDSLTDVVRTAGTRIEHWLNLGRYTDGEGRFGSVLPDGTLSDDPIVSCQLFKGTFIRFSDPRVKLADMNGDGLQDIVVVDFGQVAYWPNKGWGNWGVGSHCDETQVGSNRHISMSNAPFMSGFDAAEIRLGDVNGDGLADMVRIRNLVVDVWLNRGGTYSPRVMIDPAPFSTGFSNRVRLADVNGSGSRDILWGDAGEYSYIDLTGGIKPRLLIKMDNGLGATTEIEYESSVAQYLRSREEGDEWASTCPYPSHVVRKVTTRDNFDTPALASAGWPAGVYEKNYRYYDCHWDGKEHEFRGFGETVVETIGDTNSPTSYTRHRFYQGVPANGIQDIDESLAGQAYRVDTWGQANLAQSQVYLSTAWTSYAVRTVVDTPHTEDNRPGLDEYYRRTVRFSYVAESHSFGYNTTNWQSGTYTPSGILAIRTEGPGGTVDQTHTASIPLPSTQANTVHIKSDTKVDDLAQVTRSRAFGQVDKPPLQEDPIIEKHAIYAKNETKWIHRVCETWIAEGTSNYNRKLEHYDSSTSSWNGGACTPAHPTPGGTAGCEIGNHGLTTKGTFEVCYEDGDSSTPVERSEIEEHLTDFTSFGLPTHSNAFKKLESWVYYEDPRGYQALPTREVIRVGLDHPIADYGSTPVKFLTNRVSYDVGLGLISEYRDENDQKSMAVYDHLGRLTELWGPREPNAANCSSGGNSLFMRAASVEYHVTTDPAAQPYSFVKATTFEDACDPNDVKEAWSFADGLGRNRMTVGEADENPTGCQTDWIGSGYATFDTKGAKQRVLAPTYLASFVPANPALPAALQESCPSHDDRLSPCTVCASTTRYDAFGRIVETVLPNGDTSRTEHRGPLETWAYDGNDTGVGSSANLDFVDSPSKMRTDGHGRLVETEVSYLTRNHAGGALLGPVPHYTSYSYNPLGNLISLRNCTTGERFELCSGTPIEKQQDFDSIGQRRLIVDPDAGTWRFAYDDAGNLTDSWDGKWHHLLEDGNHIQYLYDAANRLLQEKCVQCVHIDPDTVLVRYYYDSPVSMKGGRGYMDLDPDPADDEPQDWLLGRLTRIADETGWVLFSYDRLGRQVTEAQHIEALLPDGGAPITGSTEVYIGRVAYDDAGRVIQITYPDPDPSDTKPALEVYNSYNRRGLLAAIIGPDPFSAAIPSDPDYWYEYVKDIRYNAKGQRIGYSYGDAAQTLHQKWYDRLGRLKEKKVNQTVETDPTNRPAYDLLWRKLTYDAASNIIAIEDLRDHDHVDQYSSGENLPYDLDITHDSLNRVTKVRYLRRTDELAAYPGRLPLRREMRYAYNAVGNLIQRSTTDGNGEVNPGWEIYEKWLNESVAPGEAITAPTDHPHAFGEADTTDAAPPGENRRIKASYDANGNMESLEVTDSVNGRYDYFEYTWDHYDRLITVRKYDDGPGSGPDPLPGGTGIQIAVAHYAYDSGGRRVIKLENTESDLSNKVSLYVTEGLEIRNHQHMHYVFDGDRRVARLGVTRPNEEVPAGGQPTSYETRAVFVQDYLGSTSVAIVDRENASSASIELGSVGATTSNLPFGSIEKISGSETALTSAEYFFQFAGKERERGIGLTYFGARYYNPQLGIFLSADVISVFVDNRDHPFGYVGGMLFIAVDKDGNQCGYVPETLQRYGQCVTTKKVKQSRSSDVATQARVNSDGGTTVTTRNSNGNVVEVHIPKPTKKNRKGPTLRASPPETTMQKVDRAVQKGVDWFYRRAPIVGPLFSDLRTIVAGKPYSKEEMGKVHFDMELNKNRVVTAAKFIIIRRGIRSGPNAPRVVAPRGRVHGNSAASTKPQHRYEIKDRGGDRVKTGISGQPLNRSGTSPRANRQVNALNRREGAGSYSADVVETNIPGRAAALRSERAATNQLHRQGNTLRLQRRPKPE